MTTTDPSPGSARKEGTGFILSYGAGRTCREPTCETVLSRYNDAAVCWAHDDHRRRSAARP